MEFLALDMAFGPLALRKLNCEVIGRNDRFIRMRESVGFVQEGLFHGHVLIDGTLNDVQRLPLFAHNWVGLRPAKPRSLTERQPK